GFFSQVPQGIFAIDIFSTPSDNQALFNSGTQPNSLCQFFICLAPGVNIYGQAATPTPPFNVVQLVRNFQTPMNHAYNLTIEQELSHKTAVSVAYVGTLGRDLVNWRDLNACPVSTLKCASSTVNRQPFTARFPNPDPTVVGGLYNHILQLNNDGYSN